MAMIDDNQDVLAVQARLKQQNPDRLVAIRIEATPACKERILALARGGAEVIHLVFDRMGERRRPVPSPDEPSVGARRGLGRGQMETAKPAGKSPHPLPLSQRERGVTPSPGPLPEGAGTWRPRHARDVLREVHRALVKDGMRDQITLVASGGIAQAEHMAKAIICGADLVAIDVPLLLALECRLCGQCERGEDCPVELGRGRNRLRRASHREPDRRVASAVDRGSRRDGHSRGASTARRNGAGDVFRGSRTRFVRPNFGKRKDAI